MLVMARGGASRSTIFGPVKGGGEHQKPFPEGGLADKSAGGGGEGSADKNPDHWFYKGKASDCKFSRVPEKGGGTGQPTNRLGEGGRGQRTKNQSG